MLEIVEARVAYANPGDIALHFPSLVQYGAVLFGELPVFVSIVVVSVMLPPPTDEVSCLLFCAVFFQLVTVIFLLAIGCACLAP